VEVVIDLRKLVSNYRKIAAHAKPARVLCVLKANAYGLGVGAYARALYGAGCRAFGVAEPFEALELEKVLAEEAKMDFATLEDKAFANLRIREIRRAIDNA
jgi:alanine racemase